MSGSDTFGSAEGSPEPEDEVMSPHADESEVQASNDGTPALGEDPLAEDSSFGAAGAPGTTTETGAGIE